MRARWLVMMVVGPMILACGGLPKLPGSEEEKPAAAPNASLTELDAALDQLGEALDKAEAADPAALDPARIGAAKSTLDGTQAAFEPVVMKVTAPAP